MKSFFKKPLQEWIYFSGLIIAGESIYMLPYMRKTFQTSMESFYDISATEIGLLNSMFGVLAIICYFPSGWIADRFPLKRLLILSLVATGCGGLSMLFVRSFEALLAIHAFWGITAILTFWSALIKATRRWAATDEQGKSFGLLDAGRGAVAALTASVATLCFSQAATLETSFFNVIYVYSFAPILAALILAISMKKPNDQEVKPQQSGSKAQLLLMLKNKRIWAMAGIIFCAYTLYVGSFDLPAFAEKTFDLSKTQAAIIGTLRDWLRPIMALLAGVLADKFTGRKTIFGSFCILLISYASIALLGHQTNIIIFWLQLIGIASAVFALRGIYFALLEELDFSISNTGKIVGLVSFIGYIPDAFIHLLSGLMIDEQPHNQGYYDFFLLLSFMALLGVLISGYLISLQRNKSKLTDK
jgi:sugar phosphate permease